jgi:hypothetical protein
MICILLLYEVLKFLSYRYTNFFNLFNLVSETHSKNIISKVLYADVLHTAPPRIKEAASSFFSALCTRPQHKRAPLGEVGYKKINVEKASCLKRPVSMEEISLGL